MSGDLKDLTFKYFMGTLTPEERTALLKMLENPDLQARFVRESTMYSVLHEWATEELQAPKSVTTRRHRAVSTPRSSWPWAFAAAALFLIAIWFASGHSSDPAPTIAPKVEPAREVVERREPDRPRVAPPVAPKEDDGARRARIEEELRKSAVTPPKPPDPVPPPPPSTPKPEPEPASPRPAATAVAIATVEGDVWVLSGGDKSAAKPGQDLLAGQGLEAFGRASIKFSDKTRIDLESGTVLREVGKRIQMDRGQLRAEVAKQPKDQPLVFVTPHGEAKVLGTTLKLVVADDTRLDVEEGKVQLKNLAGKLVLVESGHYAVATREPELVAKMLPLTVVFGGGVSKAEDTFIYGWPGFEDKNYGASATLRLSDGAQGFATLLRFPNLVGMKPGQIVPKSRVTSALLRLKALNRGPDTSAPFRFYRCLKPWGEGKGSESVAQRGEACWKAAQQVALPWEAPGATGRTDHSAELGVVGVNIDRAGYVTFDVTPFIQAWVSGETNYGFLIVGQGGVEYQLSSSEDKTAANRPQLTVTFSY